MDYDWCGCPWTCHCCWGDCSMHWDTTTLQVWKEKDEGSGYFFLVQASHQGIELLWHNGENLHQTITFSDIVHFERLFLNSVCVFHPLPGECLFSKVILVRNVCFCNLTLYQLTHIFIYVSHQSNLFMFLAPWMFSFFTMAISCVFVMVFVWLCYHILQWFFPTSVYI